jgi:hypothetical protein
MQRSFLQKSFIQDLIVTGFGFITSWATARGLVYLEQEHEISIYGWLYMFVIPIGAILSGFVAATGYWIGARLVHHRPSKSILWNMVLVSVLTFFMIHEQGHELAVKRGYQKGITSYIQEVTESISYSSRRSSDRSPGTPLGKLGYGVVALEILGFSFGAFGVFGVLRSRQYCEGCNKYFAKKGQRVRYLESGQELETTVQAFHEAVAAGQLQEAVNQFCQDKKTKISSKKLMCTLHLYWCKECGTHQILFAASQLNGNQWAAIPELGLNLNTSQSLEIPAKI